MHPKHHVHLTALFVLASACAGAVAARAQAPADNHAALFGAWRLDRQASSPAAEGDRGDKDEPRGRRGGGGGGFRGGFGGRQGGFGRGGGEAVDRERMEQMRAVMEELMTPDARMLIIGNPDGTVSFTYPDGRTMKFATDGKAEKHQLTNGVIETKTKWDGGVLRQEITLQSGPKLIRTYEALQSPKELVVKIGNEGGRERQSLYQPDTTN